MRDQYIRSGEGFILVFDLTDMESLKYIETAYEQLQNVLNEQKPSVVIVGNKSDLPYRQVLKEGKCLNFQC
jgi:GTPase SAR1 family protein